MNAEAYQEIVDVVRRMNREHANDPLPTVPDLVPQLDQRFYRDSVALNAALKALVESNMLFVLHLVEPDERLKIEAVSAYVTAEASVVNELRDFADARLEAAYERQFYRRRGAASIIKELFPEIKKYNNSPLGRILNAAVMLGQFASVLDRDPNSYSEAEKRRRLKEYFAETYEAPGPDAAAPAPPVDEDGEPRRAVDAVAGLEAEEMDLSGAWGEAVEKFGVEFLLRIHFRKHEFNKIKFLVNTRKIARETDLIFIRDTVRTLQTRAMEGRDPQLRGSITAMQNLLSSVHVKLQIIQLEKEEKGL